MEEEVFPKPYRYAAALAALTIAIFASSGCGGEMPAQTATTTGQSGAEALETPIPYQPDPTITVPEEQPSPYGPGSTGPQVVGTLVDGLQLRDIRWGDHGTYYRVVFEVGTPDGQQILQVPHAEASMSADGKQIRVVLGGIRSIGTNSNVTSATLPVGDTLVSTIRRLPESDDQALVYSIDLTAPAAYSLTGIGAPGRAVIDIEKS
jgi:hypothetical protein